MAIRQAILNRVALIAPALRETGQRLSGGILYRTNDFVHRNRPVSRIIRYSASSPPIDWLAQTEPTERKNGMKSVLPRSHLVGARRLMRNHERTGTVAPSENGRLPPDLAHHLASAHQFPESLAISGQSCRKMIMSRSCGGSLAANVATLFPWLLECGWPCSFSKPIVSRMGLKRAEMGSKWLLIGRICYVVQDSVTPLLA